MAVALVLQTPVGITGVVAVHDDNGIIFVLRDDPDDGVPMQVKAFQRYRDRSSGIIFFTTSNDFLYSGTGSVLGIIAGIQPITAACTILP